MADDFYIGYDGPIPDRSRRLVFGSVATLFAVAAIVAGVLVAGQRPFAAGTFDYGRPREFAGVVTALPYPTLHTSAGPVMLVGPGKHGVQAAVREFDGKAVRGRGMRIQRGAWMMIEVIPGSLEVAGVMPAADGRARPSDWNDLGELTLEGEIVDGKCYFGVMNPGEGTVHRDCATVCIRGGLPPLFAVRFDDGRTVLMTMLTRDGHPLGAALAPLAGQPVVVVGRVRYQRGGDLWTIEADEKAYRLTSR